MSSMGPVASFFKKKEQAVAPVKKQEEEGEEGEEGKRKDGRRKNSLVSDMFLYIENERLDDRKEMAKIMQPEIDKKKKKIPDWNKAELRIQKKMKTADEVACGNMKKLRDLVIQEFKNINNSYPDKWDEETALHIACREGYFDMVKAIFALYTHSGHPGTKAHCNGFPAPPAPHRATGLQDDR